MEEIARAKEMINKIKAGIGGSTIAIHAPSGWLKKKVTFKSKIWPFQGANSSIGIAGF